MTDPVEQVAIPLRGVWRGADELEILHADQIAMTVRGGFGVLTIGQLVEPIITPGDSHELDRLRASGEIGIRPLARFAIPRSSIAEWAAVFARLAAVDGSEQATPEATNG